METQIRKCKEGLSIILPDNLVAQLGWEHGDILSAAITAGSATITRTMTAHDHAMKIAHEMMDEYRETFEALAKS